MARTKGARNKVGAEVKREIMGVYDRIGGGTRFAKWAEAHESEFFRIYAALAPKELSVETFNDDASERSTAEIRQRIAELEQGIARAASGGVAQAGSSGEPDPVH